MAFPLLAGIGALGAGVIGAAEGSSARGDAIALAQQSVSDLEAIGVPTVEAQQIVLEKYKSAGLLTPQLENAVLQGSTNLNDISVDPAYQQTELRALNELADLGSSGGMRLSDKARLYSTLDDIGVSEKGSRDAIAANLKERGAYGSGLELAMQLANQQGSADRAAKTGAQIYGDASDRALEAILKGGEMAGNIGSREFNQQAQVKSAQDAIDRFNTMNRADVNQRNVANINQANEFNLKNNQRIMDANTDTANQQEVHNKGLWQDYFNNQLSKESAKANARANQGSNIVEGGKAASQMWGGIGQGIGQIGSAYAQNEEDENKKKVGL